MHPFSRVMPFGLEPLDHSLQSPFKLSHLISQPQLFASLPNSHDCWCWAMDLHPPMWLSPTLPLLPNLRQSAPVQPQSHVPLACGSVHCPCALLVCALPRCTARVTCLGAACALAVCVTCARDLWALPVCAACARGLWTLPVRATYGRCLCELHGRGLCTLHGRWAWALPVHAAWALCLGTACARYMGAVPVCAACACSLGAACARCLCTQPRYSQPDHGIAPMITNRCV